MADEKLPDSPDESDETPTFSATGSSDDTPAELTSDQEIDDPRDTPDDDYVDDPSTPDINEAKLDRATDEAQYERDGVEVNPLSRRRSRANRPLRRGEAGADTADSQPEPEPVRIGAGRVRDTAPVRRERSTGSDSDSKRVTPAKFVAQSVGELRKVVWPTGSQVQQYFVVVLIFVLFIMTVVSLLDLGFGWVVLKVFG